MPRHHTRLKNIPWKSNKKKIYLNWCGAERVREDVLSVEERFREWQHLYEDDPKGCMRTLHAAVARSRQAVSQLIGCPDPKHLLFTTGSEGSLKDVLFSHQLVPWGSRILATDCEFYGIYAKIAPPRYCTDIVQIWEKSSQEEIIAEIIGKVRADTRLLLVSHVCYNSGLALPIAEICERVKAKNSEVLVLVDGAQGVGQVPVNVDRLGCDFYAGDGHKWLVGPDQTGFLYVRSSEHLQIIARDLCSVFAVHEDLNHDKGSRSGAIAFELAALGETLQPFLDGNSLIDIQQRSQALAASFRRGVEEQLSQFYCLVPATQHIHPTGTVSLTLANPENSGDTLEGIYDDLLAEGIHCAVIKRIPAEFAAEIQIPPLLRFCFHFWNEEEEVETVIQRLLLLAKKNGMLRSAEA